jgi:hypothetical protein
MSLMSPEPTAIPGAGASDNAMARHTAVTRWLSFFRYGLAGMLAVRRVRRTPARVMA